MDSSLFRDCHSSGLWGLTSIWLPQQEALYMKGRELTPQLSQSSVLSLADSHTEFFDACEVLLSASSSENEVREEGAGSRRGGTWAGWGWGLEIPESFLTKSVPSSVRLVRLQKPLLPVCSLK